MRKAFFHQKPFLILAVMLGCLTFIGGASSDAGSYRTVLSEEIEGTILAAKELPQVSGTILPEEEQAEPVPTSVREEGSDISEQQNQPLEAPAVSEPAPAEDAAPASPPYLWTDKLDYFPGELVTIFGKYFNALQEVFLKIFGGTAEQGTYTETTANVTADENGAFTYQHQLDNVYRPDYAVTASTPEGELLAQTTFKDAANPDLKGFRANQGGGGALDTGWTGGNLGNTWAEGEWVPYKLVINKVQESYPNLNGLLIEVSYDFTRGGTTRFVDLVRGLQVGTTDLTNLQGWPDDSGSPYPLTTRTQIENAQNDIGNTAPLDNVWNGFTLLNLPDSQINRALDDGVGTVTSERRKFTITKQDLLDAHISETANTVVIYWQLHESRTFVWSNGLQSGYDANPTAAWGGYLYGDPPFSEDTRNGSGYVPGSSGHIHLESLSGSSDVPIPIPERLPGIVSGMKWRDDNGNGLKDGTEPALSGWHIYVSGMLEGILFSDSTSTDSFGNYSFANLTSGVNWIIKEDAQRDNPLEIGYNQTFPTVGTTIGVATGISVSSPPADVAPVGWSVALTLANSSQSNVNFGNRLAYGTIIIVKDTVPDDSQDFSFTATGGLSPLSFSLDDDTDGTLSNTYTYNNVMAGTYSVTENAVLGFDLTNLSCDDPDLQSTTFGPTATIDLDPNETITCTFNNTKRGHIIVDKVTYPEGDAQNFSFDAGGGSYSDFSLAHATAPNNQELAPGTYQVAELPVSGWYAKDPVCTSNIGDSETNADLELDPGETITCAFTNIKIPKISITPTETNEVGSSHTFTVTVGQQGSGGFVPVADGTKPAVSFAPSAPGTVTDNCASIGTVNGSCTVEINSVVAGVFTAHASVSVTIGGHTFSIETDGQGENSGNAVKTYVDAKIVLTPGTATNDINDPHTITATVSENPGSSFVPAEGELVTFTLLNNTAGAAFVGGVDNCTTNASGQCTVQINSSAPGSVDIHGSVDAMVGGLILHRETDGTHGSSGNASKTYVAGKIIVIKQTLPDGDQTSFEFDPSWSGSNFNLSDGDSEDSGWLAPGSYSVAEVNIPANWTLTGSNCSDGSTVNNISLAAGETVTCTFTDAYTPPLEVSKTANTSYIRTFGWEIEKSVIPASWSMFAGDSGTSRYTVSVTKDNGTDSDWQVNGNIIIHNPAAIAAIITGVSDEVTGGIAASVDCGVTLPYELAPDATLNCTYSSDLPDGTSRTNTATVTTSGYVPGSLGNADVTFGDPTTLVNNKVNVNDTNGDSWQFGDSGSVSYDKTFECDSDEGAHGNTATITETGQSDSASVTVNCYVLQVSKDADTSFDRTYAWTIDKTGDQTSLNLAPGQTYQVNYSVTVDNTGYTDSNWDVAGTITVHNPATVAATINSVTDVISPAISGNVDCGVSFPYDLSAGGTLNCAYSSELPDASSRTNSATVVLQNYDYGHDLSATADGTINFTGGAAVDFSGAAINEIDECIDVSDTYAKTLGEVCVGDAPKTYTYSRQVGPYTAESCGIPQQVDNTADFVTNDTGATGDDSWRVTVAVQCVCSLTQGYWKTHSAYGPAKHTDDAWDLILPSGPDTTFFRSGQTYYQVLWTAPKSGNAYYTLAHQFIAAELNRLNGAYFPPAVQTAFNTASSTLLSVYTPAWIETMKGKNATTIRQQFIDLAEILGGFNEGLTNPAGHCSEQPY